MHIIDTVIAQCIYLCHFKTAMPPYAEHETRTDDSILTETRKSPKSRFYSGDFRFSDSE